ncbi:MAG: hypothetical protein UR96_C0032G0005 [candidate division WS6 bacterium GW2011_GWC1_36_11]|uniref:Uncharacterized protein n=2 Tax=Candidatus Dojkabacteria TaxID=74243 RepID=A0A0G0DCW6_9BACT|nr:MAG: hypothetical protein UR96_C0032G0005 [candidate division WS6 bacterium GW2011_GWC1_36_11]KKQ14816.1 MAG: hypothetical protein US29_C0059G0006 [candidate division WS6 bacterium GW2011_GWF1_36_8]HAM96585.1 hypothetical protein [Patescibacteria group bacterium]
MITTDEGCEYNLRVDIIKAIGSDIENFYVSEIVYLGDGIIAYRRGLAIYRQNIITGETRVIISSESIMEDIGDEKVLVFVEGPYLADGRANGVARYGEFVFYTDFV